jgi:uncharacterized delta-60 repeat protein
MFTPFAFIKRQVSAAIAAIGQRLLLIGNFTAFNPPIKTNGVTLIDGSDQFGSSFNVGSGTNGIVYDAEFDENGKLILGGAFTSYSGSAVNDLVRVNTDGTIDTSLNIGTGTNGEVRVAVPISGGKVLVGGTFSQYSGSTVDRIMRINSNGTLDNTFTSPPFSGGTVRTIVTQSDGKIVVGGTFGGDYRSKPYLNKTTPTNLIDTTFNQGSGPNLPVFALAEQSDGKILISGNQTNYSGSAVNSLIRINTNGTLDTSWATGTGGNSILPVSGGKVLVAGTTTIAGIRRYNSNGTTDSSFDVGRGASSTVYTAATQSNGKIIIGGAFTSFGNQGNNTLIKLTLSSSIDYSFNQGAGPDNYIYTFATQSDGKILIGGAFTTYSGSSSNRLARINTDGSRDASFNVGTQGFNGDVNVVKVQPDGKILVGGAFSSYSGSAAQNRIIRLNSNGTIDATFVKGTGFSSIVYDLQLQSDGKIVAVGAFSTTYSGSTSPRIVRINTDGTKDFTFNMGTTGFSSNQYSCQIQNDGKIIVVGLNATYSGSAAQRIRRINTNGTLDTTFNIGTAGLNNTTYKAIIQPDQKIVVMGSFTSYSGSAVNRITRINPNGTRDLTFNVGTGFDTATGQPAALELDSTGNIYAGSTFTTYSGSQVNYFVRISPSGSIAPGAPGFVGVPDASGFNNQVYSILVDSARSIYVGTIGNYRNANYIARLNTNGTLDPTFEQGLVGFSFTVNKIQVQADDKIIVGGNFASYSGSSNPGIVRLNANGTKDTTFNIGTGGFFGGQVTNIKIQPDQKIIAMGGFTSYSGSAVNRITRINTDGTRDLTFNVGTGFDSVTVVPSALELDSSGNIYAGSDFLTYSGSTVNRFVKISPSGSIITGSLFYNGYGGTVRAIVVDSSGGIYTGGEFTTYPFRYNGILRLNEDGTADSSFNVGLNGLGDISDVVRSLKIQPDGKILAGGTFYTYSGSSNPFMVRINTNGSKDTSFNQGTGFGSSIHDLQLQNDGKIVVGGGFSSYSGSSNIYYIARINPDGTRDTSFYITQGVNSLSGNTEKLLIDNSGSIHVLHYPNSNPYRYFKYLSSGSLDNNGITVQGTSGTPAVTSLAKDSLNNIFLLGQSPFTVFKQNNNGIVAFENSSNSTSSLFNPGTGFLNTSTNQLGNIPIASVKTTSGDIWLSSIGTQYYSGSQLTGDLFKINQQGKLIATSSTTYWQQMQTLQSQPDGKILAGYTQPYYAYFNPYRFNSDGSVDPNSYNSYLWYTIYSIQVQSTGKILIGGDFQSNVVVTYDDGEGGTYDQDTPTSPGYLLRLNSNLTVDGTFLQNQINGPVYNINTLPDDSSILTGFFQLYTGAEKENIAKIDANGNLDYTYIVGSGFSAPVLKTALQPDNKLIAAGNFTQYSGSSGVSRLVRLNTNGSIDTTFNPGSGFNNFDSTNSKILIDNLGNIHVAGGGFTSYSGSAVSGYVKILPNGNIDPTGTSGSFFPNQPRIMELLD